MPDEWFALLLRRDLHPWQDGPPAAGAYRGEGKTDAKDAAIIADQARMRRDLQPMRSGDQISTELKLLTGHRADLVADRTRAVNRLRGLPNSFFPALERERSLLTPDR
ncbi:transposase [Streptomyces gardneri]|nr:transposase [Streptomyces gardneri]